MRCPNVEGATMVLFADNSLLFQGPGKSFPDSKIRKVRLEEEVEVDEEGKPVIRKQTAQVFEDGGER
jgi:hypothetical protein